MAQRFKSIKREVAAVDAGGNEGNGNGNGHAERGAIGSGQGSVYEAALHEIERASASEAERRRIEAGVLREARGNDVMRLHTTLHALTTLRDQLSAEISDLQSKLATTSEVTGTELERIRSETQDGFAKTWQTINERFDKTWETVGHNFEATNDRTSREVSDLRDEITKVLDKRFTHIDQTFASLRADIEVVKALQMDLIKERIGRADMARR